MTKCIVLSFLLGKSLTKELPAVLFIKLVLNQSQRHHTQTFSLNFDRTITSKEMTFYETKIKQIKNSCYSNDKQIETVIATRNFIDNNFKNELNLDFLATELFTSKYHLLRLFKRYYGQTPRQYLIDKRIEKSKEHLKSGMKVTKTCFAVGFESLGSFSTLFKKKTGKSPSEFQKQQFSRSKLNSKS